MNRIDTQSFWWITNSEIMHYILSVDIISLLLNLTSEYPRAWSRKILSFWLSIWYRGWTMTYNDEHKISLTGRCDRDIINVPIRHSEIFPERRTSSIKTSRRFGSQLVERCARVHPPECIPPRHCFSLCLFTTQSPSLFIIFLTFFTRQKYRMDFGENWDFIGRLQSAQRYIVFIGIIFQATCHLLSV